MNDAYDVLVLGPTGRGRETLERTLRRLGCAVESACWAEGGALAGEGRHDVVVVDARGAEADGDLPTGLDGGSCGPLLVLAAEPTALVRELVRRPAGAMLLTGAEGDPGYRVALGVCAGLARRRRAALEPSRA
jgi:hypothetical protein